MQVAPLPLPHPPGPSDTHPHTERARTEVQKRTHLSHGGIVRESGPGFSTKPAKVQLMLRKHFRTTFGPKAAKAPPFQACPKAAKASRHTWYVGTGPKHTRTASQPPWDPLGHITPAAKSLPHEGEGLRTQRQVRPVRWLHVTRSSVDRLTRKARESAPAKNRLMVAKACESDLILEA